MTGPADRQKSYIPQGLQEISASPPREKPTQKKCKAEKGTFHRIWMGVGRPKDFVTILNRFPIGFQLVTRNSNKCFGTIFGENLVVLLLRSAQTFRSMPTISTRRFEHPEAPAPRCILRSPKLFARKSLARQLGKLTSFETHQFRFLPGKPINLRSIRNLPYPNTAHCHTAPPSPCLRPGDQLLQRQ
jgi:hypothetical protein